MPIVAVVSVAAVVAAIAVSSLPDRRARAGQDRNARIVLSPSDGFGRSQVPSPVESPSSAPAADQRLVPFAHWHGLELSLPSRDVRCVCYHEAAYHDALALQPLGRLRKDYNSTKFPRNEPRTKGPDYLIMSSRGRATPATSAADLVMPRRTEVFAPVSGVVTKAKRYRLYGRYVDVHLEIKPDTAPEVRVAMIHVDDVHVRPGDRVTQGVSVIGVPRVFPFGDQADLYIPGRDPHLHLEVLDPDTRK